MKAKTSGLFIVGILSLVICLSLVSATITFSNIPTLSKSGNSANITITSTKNETVTLSGLAIIVEGTRTITFTPLNTISLVENQPTLVTINYNVPSGFQFNVGKTYSTSLIVTDSTTPTPVSYTQTLTFAVSDFCTIADNTNLDITIDDIQTTDRANGLKSFGSDEDFWYPLDNVKIRVNIENNGNEKISSIKTEWAIYTKDGEKITDGDESTFSLSNGDDKDIEFSFEIDPKDLDADTQDYVLCVRATGDDKEFDVDTCSSDSQDVEIRIEDNFVILGEITIPETVQCGQEITISGDVWNIGADDQDSVYVILYNQKLGLNNVKVDVGDINSLDSETFSYTFKVPKDASLDGKTQVIEIRVYDEDNDIYENEENDKSTFTPSLKVSGGCGLISGQDVLVSAALASGGKAGQDLTIKATITNAGSDKTTFLVSASGYDAWASSATLDQTQVELNAGQSKEVIITLKVNSDAVGENIFDIGVSSNGVSLAKQPVSVTIEKAGFTFPGFTGNVINSGNWYLWGIGLLNVILVLIIIIVAVKVAKS